MGWLRKHPAVVADGLRHSVFMSVYSSKAGFRRSSFIFLVPQVTPSCAAVRQVWTGRRACRKEGKQQTRKDKEGKETVRNHRKSHNEVEATSVFEALTPVHTLGRPRVDCQIHVCRCFFFFFLLFHSSAISLFCFNPDDVAQSTQEVVNGCTVITHNSSRPACRCISFHNICRCSPCWCDCYPW
jgi:hypothetical protein